MGIGRADLDGRNAFTTTVLWPAATAKKNNSNNDDMSSTVRMQEEWRGTLRPRTVELLYREAEGRWRSQWNGS